MSTIGITKSLCLLHLSKNPFDVLQISFSPRGIIEMALIALTLGTNPALVHFHHTSLILFTVVVIARLGKNFPKFKYDNLCMLRIVQQSKSALMVIHSPKR